MLLILQQINIGEQTCLGCAWQAVSVWRYVLVLCRDSMKEVCEGAIAIKKFIKFK